MGPFNSPLHPRGLDGKFGQKPIGPKGVGRKPNPNALQKSVGPNIKPSSHKVPKVDSVKRGSRRGG